MRSGSATRGWPDLDHRSPQLAAERDRAAPEGRRAHGRPVRPVPAVVAVYSGLALRPLPVEPHLGLYPVVAS